MAEMKKIKNSDIALGMSINGGWSRDQLQALGVDWPPAKGWRRSLTGTLVSVEAFAKFIELKDKHVKGTK